MIPNLTYWGQVYPRCGWVVHPYDAITGAVMAHRAAEIVTGAPSLHVAVPAGDDCGENAGRLLQWKPTKLKPINSKAYFQFTKNRQTLWRRCR